MSKTSKTHSRRGKLKYKKVHDILLGAQNSHNFSNADLF
jgi:hypothetical protein